MATININGQMYSMRDVEIRLGTTLVTGITELTYTKAVPASHHHGSNRGEPVGYTRGFAEYTGSATLYIDEIRRLSDASPGGDITARPPENLTVTFLADVNSFSDVCVGIVWQSMPMSTGTGDAVTQSIDFLPTGGIRRNI